LKQAQRVNITDERIEKMNQGDLDNLASNQQTNGVRLDIYMSINECWRNAAL